MTFGIIDVGTNSIHLLIGRVRPRRAFRIVLERQELVRLGEGGLANNRLTQASMDRALGVLRQYVRILKRHGVEHTEAVATSAVRQARDGVAFVRRVRTQLGVPLRVIGGREEARLIYLGVLQARRFRGATLIIAIGGGSAQVIHGRDAQVEYAASVPLGGARLSQRFIHHDLPRPDEVAALTAYVRRAWEPVARALRRHRWQQVLGSSALIHQLIMAAHLRGHRKPPNDANRASVTQAALRRLVDWLAHSTARQRKALRGLDPRRQDLAFPTAVTLLTWMERCGIAALQFAPGSLREGLIVDSLVRHHQHRAGGPLRLAAN